MRSQFVTAYSKSPASRHGYCAANESVLSA
jgi:hypothetical protein